MSLENFNSLTTSSPSLNAPIVKINIWRFSTNLRPNYYLIASIPVGQTSYLDVKPDSQLT